jgi:hypothetical protein
MTQTNEGSFSVASLVGDVFAIPSNFLMGFAVGLAAPVAAIAAMVAGVRMVTGKVPFLSHTWDDEEGGRHLSFKLVPPDEVGTLFAEQKKTIGNDLVKMQAEIKAIIQEARGDIEAMGSDEPMEA